MSILGTNRDESELDAEIRNQLAHAPEHANFRVWCVDVERKMTPELAPLWRAMGLADRYTAWLVCRAVSDGYCEADHDDDEIRRHYPDIGPATIEGAE